MLHLDMALVESITFTPHDICYVLFEWQSLQEGGLWLILGILVYQENQLFWDHCLENP